MAKCPQPDKKQAAPLEESACFLIKLLTKMSCAWSAAWSVLPLNQIRVIDDIAYIVCASRYRDLKANNNFIEKKLKVVATTRNFNTMSKLIALSTGTDGVSPANIQ